MRGAEAYKLPRTSPLHLPSRGFDGTNPATASVRSDSDETEAANRA